MRSIELKFSLLIPDEDGLLSFSRKFSNFLHENKIFVNRTGVISYSDDIKKEDIKPEPLNNIFNNIINEEN
ncbi:MAG TPA: hypothetical protein PKZ75_12970 [Bacteroidia bacterium]|nr:hypothetical protein [Bacteroidia bacterium]